MSDSNFQPFCILIYYPCGAGGKFIINSLGLSRHCVPHHIGMAIWDISQQIVDSSYYQQKLQQVLKTVPEYKQEARKWQQYELGVFNKWIDLSSVPPTVGTSLKNIIAHNRYFCTIAHTPEDLQLYLDNFPNIKHVIKLTNYSSWLKISRFKIPELENNIDNKIKYWKFIDEQELNNSKLFYKLIDIDNSMFDYDRMLDQVKNLYSYLNFDDFNKELWTAYYQKYINFHKVQ
jgi:hypothetical protein